MKTLKELPLKKISIYLPLALLIINILILISPLAVDYKLDTAYGHFANRTIILFGIGFLVSLLLGGLILGYFALGSILKKEKVGLNIFLVILSLIYLMIGTFLLDIMS